MKTIIYLVIITVIFITLTSAMRKVSGSDNTIIIQSDNKNGNPALLAQSAKIISARLKLAGIDSFEINILADKGQIKVQLPDNRESSEIVGLLTSKGELAFYETYNRKEIADLLKNSDHLFTLLKSDPGKSPADPKLGCVIPEDFYRTDEYLHSITLADTCRLFWGRETDKSLVCLFALKTSAAGKPLIVRSDIETIKSSVSKGSQIPVTDFKLKRTATGIFANATKRDLYKAIAIVLDDKVLSYPIVKNVIDSGEIEISGSLSEKQIDYFLALVNTEPLPLNFKVLK
jgi:hypothetical protein